MGVRRVILLAGGAAPCAALREWQGQARLAVERSDGPAQALERMRDSSYDAVLCDATPDEEPALALVRELRVRRDATPCVLIVAAPVHEAASRRARMLGATVVLVREGLSAEQIAAALVGKPADPLPARKVDRAPAMLWKTDADGQFTHFNQRWCRFTGRSEEKERGTGWLDAVHPEDGSTWSRHFSGALAGRREFTIDLRLRPEGSDFRWVRCRGSPAFDAEGRFTGYLGASFDVTDLVQANSDALRRTEQLSRTNRDLENLLQVVSHDLNEPLRTLANDLGGLAGAHAERARDDVRRMQQLLADLLECARFSGRAGPLEPTDLAVPLGWALANLRGLNEESSAKVSFDALPVVNADPIQIAQLFQNLIANALRFRRDVPAWVHLGVDPEQSDWRFWVQDNGRGIPSEFHERIFEPFERLGRAGEGRGVGLAIARRIVERHGGRIWVESEPERGSRFYFSLPK